MARFLINVPHESNVEACVRAIKVFLTYGSHFLTHAEWGCMDGDHRAWIIVDVDGKKTARNIVPPQYRADAEIIKLNRFSMEKIDEMFREHSY